MVCLVGGGVFFLSEDYVENCCVLNVLKYNKIILHPLFSTNSEYNDEFVSEIEFCIGLFVCSDSPAVFHVALLVSDGADTELPSPWRGEVLVMCARQGCTCAGLKAWDLVRTLAHACRFLVLVSDSCS